MNKLKSIRNCVFLMVLMSIILQFGLTKSFAIEESYRVRNAKETMKKDNISNELSNKLLAKIRRGEILESEKENALPVKTDVSYEGDYKVINKTFSDESYVKIKITDIERIKKDVKPLRRGSWTAWISKTGTVVYRDSFYTEISGAEVYKSHGVYGVSFKFDYAFYRDGGEIKYTYGERSASGGGTISLGTSRIVKSKSNYAGPARAEMQFSFSGYLGIAAYSGVVGITVDSRGVDAY